MMIELDRSYTSCQEAIQVLVAKSRWGAWLSFTGVSCDSFKRKDHHLGAGIFSFRKMPISTSFQQWSFQFRQSTMRCNLRISRRET